MADPLSQIITLLRPRAVFAKGISGAGRWGVRYGDFGQPSFSAVLEGGCRLAVDGEPPLTLEAGDFVLLPATPGFTLSSFDSIAPKRLDPKGGPAPREEIRHGRQTGPADVRLLGGWFLFDTPDAALLVSLLPRLIHVRGARRLATFTNIVREETLAERSGRDLVRVRLVELMLIEALRESAHDKAPPGLLRGLSDPRIAAALRDLHADPAQSWTIADLAKSASLSRSAFFDRFRAAVGVSPMDYLLTWRMALAKDLLRTRKIAIDTVAARVGYASASTFSTAFSQHVGLPPGRYARDHEAARQG